MALNLKRKREKEGLTGQGKRPQISIDDRDSSLGEPEDAMDDQASKGGAGSGEDDEGWAGEGERSENEAPASADQADLHAGKKGRKPPTGEELRAIKDAADLFQSSSFKLQIDALLPNVRPKSSRIPPLDRFLLALHTLLMSLPSVAPQHPLEGARTLIKKGIAVPYSLPLPTEDTNWKVSFEKPTNVTLVGSWANKVSVKDKDGGRYCVDLAVDMPESLFQEKDYLNGRFFHKRAFYLATIAAAIQHKKSGLDVDIFYESRSNDPRITTLVLRPYKDNSPNDFTKLNAQVHIIPVLSSPSPIPLHRLSPSHSNIHMSSSVPSDTRFHPPTPIYNTSLLLSVTPKPDLLITHTLKQTAPAFGDALTLLRVWANQRGYGGGDRLCVRGFEGKGGWWAGIIGLLLYGEEDGGGVKRKLRRPVGRGLSSYQMFRAALDFLAKHDFEKEPLFLKTKNGHQFLPEEYTAHHEAVFVDAASTVNLLAGVPLGSLEMLKHDAKKTLEILDNKFSRSRDPFTDVFLKEQRDLPARFDTIIRVDVSSAKPRTPAAHSTLDYGSQTNALLAQLAATLRRGLGDRTKAVAILHPKSEVRSISQAHPSNPSIIHVALIHDPEHASRLVDHGPAADDPDPSHAERFREFWGDKAELRRFKDGRIVESVVWEVKTSDERAHVPSMVVRYLLGQHFGLPEDAVQTWQPAFDSTLRLPESIVMLHQASAGVTSGFKGALTAFDHLVKVLKALDDELPLSLVNVSPVSEYLRYTSVFTPVALSARSAASMPMCWRYFPAMEIVLEFEKSAKWPDDLRAIQKIKIAFFERVASALMNSKQDIKATVVVGDGIGRSDIQDQSRLEIVTAEGWAFSACIWHDREATLLNRIIDDKPRSSIASQMVDESKSRDRQEALEARELYARRFIHAPRHHRAITSLCHRFAAYAGTVRLVKRWLASHWLLHGHISEEAVEIICAAFFVGDGSILGAGNAAEQRTTVPGTKERGFAAVVEFLKDWNWEEGMYVPLYGIDENGGSPDDETTVTTRAKLGVWKVSTKQDRTGHVWTSGGPNIMAAHRVRVIAKATWDYLAGMETGNLDVKGLFTHPTEDYDFVIQLEPSILPRYFQNVAVDPVVWSQKGRYANVRPQKDDLALRPSFDPAQLLFNDIKRVYKDTLQFFYDPIGGDRIGAVWEPSVKQQRPFRVLGGFSGVPSSMETDNGKNKKSLVSLNDDGVLSEIERLASGLTKGFTIQI